MKQREPLLYYAKVCHLSQYSC